MMIKKDDTNDQLKQGSQNYTSEKVIKSNEFCHYLKFGGQTIGIKADLGAKPLVYYQYVPNVNAFVLQRAIKNCRNGTKDVRKRAVYFHTKTLRKRLGDLDSTDAKFGKKIDKIVEKYDLKVNADYLNNLSLIKWARGIKTRDLVEIKPRSDEESELADLLDRLHVSKSASAPSSVVNAASLKKKQIIKFRLIVIESILKLLKDNEFNGMYDRYRHELIVNDQPESVLNMLVRLQEEVFHFDTIKTYRFPGGFVSNINRTYSEFKVDLICHDKNGFDDNYNSYLI